MSQVEATVILASVYSYISDGGKGLYIAYFRRDVW
jgi:hypothetical protein